LRAGAADVKEAATGRAASIRATLFVLDGFDGNGLFDAQAFSNVPVILRGRALKFALQGLELHLASELRPFGIGSGYRLIGETVWRRPCLAHEILCFRDVSPNFRVHQGVKWRAARLCLLRLSKWVKAKTNPGKRHQRHRLRAKVKEPVSFHFSVPLPELWLPIGTIQVYCVETATKRFADFAIPELAF
jgi:hypothetical protein